MSGKQKKEADNRFAKFGTVSFTATTKVNDFIDYLEQDQVAGTKCLTCGTTFFPPRAQCAKCLDQARIECFQVEGAGKLITFSELMFAPAGFGEDLPYAIAVADYGDYKIFGRVELGGEKEIKPGIDVKTEVRHLPEGRLTYVFVPQ